VSISDGTLVSSTDVASPSVTADTTTWQGAVAFVLQTGAATDQVTGVTATPGAGSPVSLTRPTNGFAGISAAQIGATYAYFIDGDTLPKNASTAFASAGGTATKILTVIPILTTLGSCAVEDCKNTSGTLTNPSVTLVTGAGVATLDLAADFSGDTVTATGPGTGCTQLFESGNTSQDRIVEKATTNGTGGSIAIGFIYNNDQAALVGVAVKEAASAAAATIPPILVMPRRLAS
jgi:hypothetical protein